MAAFVKAIELGAGGIELDVQMTKDGHIVVIHDETIDRTSNASGKITNLTISELLSLDFGGWFSDEFIGEKIPTLEMVLDLLSGWEGILNIEIKSGDIGIESSVIELINKYNMRDRVIVSSFDHYTLVNVKKLDGDIKTGALFMETLYKPWEYAKWIGASAIHPDFSAITPEIIRECLVNGIEVNVFTVDNAEDIRMLSKANVSGIITNTPDTALKSLFTNSCSDR
jgi:glycerophosphoryl diester phosphodiesterase